MSWPVVALAAVVALQLVDSARVFGAFRNNCYEKQLQNYKRFRDAVVYSAAQSVCGAQGHVLAIETLEGAFACRSCS